MNRINRMLYRLVTMVLRLLGKLPRRMRNRCSAALGNACYQLDKRHRGIALRNLTIAFGKTKTTDDIQSLARMAFENLCRMVFEIGWSLNRSKPSLTHQTEGAFLRVAILYQYRVYHDLPRF